MNKKYLLYSIVPVLAGVLITVGIASASTTNTIKNNPMSDIVTAIAQKFNLSSTDVQAVVDTVMQTKRTQMQTTMEQRAADRLTQAVKDGKLTQAQANLITAKQAEIKTFMDSLAGKTMTERQTAMKTQMTALQQWAKDNNIPSGYLPIGGPMGKGGHGMRGMHFDRTTKTGANVTAN